MTITSVNPTTGKLLEKFEQPSDSELDRRLQKAADTFRNYRLSPVTERARMMLRAADLLDGRCTDLARLATTEMGKPIKAARQEIAKCAWTCRYYAETGPRFLADEPIETHGKRSYVRYRPLGPVLAIMPWNFPFWQVFRFAAPALMAGNVGLLKHASNVPRCALAIEEVFRDAGFRSGVFQTLLIGSDRVDPIIADPRVAAVTLTGSETAGSHVAGRSGRFIKKTVLELGGSDPFIVMPSADFDTAVRTAVQARVINNGQSCIAAKRIIVAHEIADRFECEFTRQMAALKVGDPMDETTDIGPLATEEVLRSLEKQVRESVSAGARLLTGGHRIDRPGNFYEPTVLSELPPSAPVCREEVFGPVAPLFCVNDAAEAVRLANDTAFGLAASAWTQNEDECRLFIEEIEAGMVFINGMVASDPRLPFGGIKQSGFGRELGSFGMREFLNVKTICIETGVPQEKKTE